MLRITKDNRLVHTVTSEPGDATRYSYNLIEMPPGGQWDQKRWVCFNEDGEMQLPERVCAFEMEHFIRATQGCTTPREKVAKLQDARPKCNLFTYVDVLSRIQEIYYN